MTSSEVSLPTTTESPLEIITRLTVELSRLDRIEQIYDRVLETLLEVLPVDRVSLLLFDDEDVMRFVASRGLSDQYRQAVEGHTPWGRDSIDAAPILVGDALTAEGLDPYRETILGEGIRALAFIPLVATAGLIGKFMLYVDEPHEFTDEEVQLSWTIATLVAFTVERARNEAQRAALFAELRREKNLLDTIIRQMPAGLLVAEASEGRLVIGNERFEQIWRSELPLPDAPEKLIEWIGYHSDGGEYEESEWPLTRSLRDGEVIDEEEIEIRRGDGTRGHVLISSAPIHDPDGRIVAAVATVADVTRLKEVEGSLRFQARASELLTSTLDTDSILRTIASIAVPTMADWCAIDLLEGDRSIRRVAVAHTDVEKVRWAREIHERYPPGDDPERNGVLRVTTTGAPELYATITDEMLESSAVDDEHLRILRELGVCSAMLVPLTARGHAFGAITFVSSESRRPFTTEDLEAATQLGQRAALAVDNGRLFEKEREAREQAERNALRTARLQEVTAALSGSITPDRVADVIIGLGIRAFDAQSGTLAVRRGRVAELIRTLGFDRSYIDPYRILPLDSEGPRFPLTDAITEGRPILIESDEKLFEAYPHLRGKTTGRHHAFAAIPLQADDYVLGAIGLSFSEPRGFDEADVEFLLALGRQCAQALDRARLYEVEREARGAAEEANRAKDDFLATLSHEMRTPLTATLGWARMLNDEDLDDETRQQAVQSIYRSSQAQVRIVEDLLDVSRIVAGKMTIERRPVDLAVVVTEAKEALIQMARSRQIVIDADLQPIIVDGDADRLRQVASNLMSNAIKFSDEGGKVRVLLRSEGEMAALEVIDEGRGIDPEFLPFLFDRFRQADSSTTRSFGGLGLGLSIVQHLIRLHGGSVEAMSEGVGKGARFRVIIPVLRDRQVDEETVAEGEEHDLTGVSVLVVEDAPDSRSLIEAIFRRAGAEVRTAAGPAEARKILDDLSPTLIVSDVAMPEEDGYSFVRSLRRQGDRTPVIALTAYGREEDVNAARAAGFDGYVRKPVDATLLIKTAAELLDVSSGRAG